MSNQADERRQHPRVPYGAWVTVSHGADKQFYLARNLSLGGVFMRSETPPDLDSEVELLLVVEGDSEPLKIQGHVVRHSEAEGGFGVRFDGMSDQDAARLLELVQETARNLAEAMAAATPS